MKISLLAGIMAIGRGALVLVMLGSALPVQAQQPTAAEADFPRKAIHFIVPFSPGSGTDTGARYFARKISELTGQPVIVDNKAGGNGFIAVKAVTSAAPDGYTILVGSNSTLATNVALFKQLPYDPIKDLVPVTGLIRAPIVLVVAANSRYKTLQDLIGSARADPGQATFGAGSAGYQLMGELFAAKADIRLTSIPYKGTPEVINATIAGDVNVGVAEITSTAEFIKSGRLRALVVASPQRSPHLPDVPTSAELGIQGFTADAWTAVAAPVGTPKAIVDKLTSLFVKVLEMPETREFAARQRMEFMPSGQDKLRDIQREQIDTWKRIAKTANVELQ